MQKMRSSLRQQDIKSKKSLINSSFGQKRSIMKLSTDSKGISSNNNFRIPFRWESIFTHVSTWRECGRNKKIITNIDTFIH